MSTGVSDSPWRRPGADAVGPRGDASDRVRILLIDDNSDYLLLIRRTLERHDSRYEVRGVGTPEEAYALLDHEAFDLVLLDYRFEQGNGLEVIRTLKGKSDFVPTVMVTAFGDEGLAIQAMREGALDFMPKTSGFVAALPEVVARGIERGRIIRERIRTQRALARRNEELQALNDIASIINTTREPADLLERSRDRLGSLLGATSSSVHLVDGDPAGVSDTQSLQRRLAPGAGADPALAQCVRTAEVVVDQGRGPLRLCVPLVSKDVVLGALIFELMAARTPTLSDRVLAANVGRQVGDALAHARVHAALVFTEGYLTDLVGNAGDEVVTIDAGGKVITWNAGAEAIYGLSPEEIVGRSWTRLWPPERHHEPEELLRRVIDGGETVANHETVRRTAGGERVEILLTLSSLRRPDGTVRGVSCIGKDVTFKKQLQAQLVQSEKMAAVGQLISGVAHELNNPLTGVLGYAQLVASTDTGERLQTYLERIAAEAGRCQRIVQNLLSFARKHEPKAVRTDLNSILRDTVELRAYDLKVNNIGVELALDDRLPTTLADAHQLQQVFVNLINNAQQAILHEASLGRLLISSSAAPGSDGRPEAVLTFDDSGPGVPDELRERVFDPFFTTKAVGVGTGLGLSLSYGIIQEHGGTIQVDASPLGGARFVVRLPLMPELARTERAEESQETAREGAAVLASVDGGARGRRILVVDSEPRLRQMFLDILEEDGHDIETVEDGREALERIDSGAPFDLVIMDLEEPELDGERLDRQVRDLDSRLAGKMLFTSAGLASLETRKNLEQSGNKFLSKPFGVDEVRRQVSSFFEE